MAIAYSGHTILKVTLRVDTSQHFRDDLDAALTTCGWATIRSVTNGKVYEATAPSSGLTMRLLVQDQGTSGAAGPYIIFQPMDHAEALIGKAYTIARAGLAFQAIAGRCQLFISIPGLVNGIFIGDHSSSFACGVPSLPPGTPASLCSVGIGDNPAVTMLWWACGPNNLAFFYDPDFRSGPVCFVQFNVGFNGVLYDGDDTVDVSSGPLTLGYLTPCFNVDATFQTQNQPVVTHGAQTPLRLDAMLIWAWAIRGQLWDAFQMSAPQLLDVPYSFVDTNEDGSTFVVVTQCWNIGYYSSLMLLTESPSGRAAFGYVY
jgi:hypothetical protein